MAARMLKQEKTSDRLQQEFRPQQPTLSGKAPMKMDTEVIAFRNDFLREAAAFEDQLPELLVRFPSEFVAIFEGKVIDHDPSWDVLAQKVRKRIPDRFVLLEQVVPKSATIVHIDCLGTVA